MRVRTARSELRPAALAMVRAKLASDPEPFLAEAVAKWLMASHGWETGEAYLWAHQLITEVKKERRAA